MLSACRQLLLLSGHCGALYAVVLCSHRYLSGSIRVCTFSAVACCLLPRRIDGLRSFRARCCQHSAAAPQRVSGTSTRTGVLIALRGVTLMVLLRRWANTNPRTAAVYAQLSWIARSHTAVSIAVLRSCRRETRRPLVLPLYCCINSSVSHPDLNVWRSREIASACASTAAAHEPHWGMIPCEVLLTLLLLLGLPKVYNLLTPRTRRKVQPANNLEITSLTCVELPC